MNQRKILSQKIKEFEIQEFVASHLKGVGLSSAKLIPTPLGDKIVIDASRPGLIVGRKGQSIKKLTLMLKKKFELENPQIEINEVTNTNLDTQIIAERIANSLERFGLARFKGVGHKTMQDVMGAGALGIEIIISGKVPSSRAKRWRFYQGYLKKCGQIAIQGVKKSYTTAQIKTGTVGITVKLMPPGLKLPDDIQLVKDMVVEESVTVEKIDASQPKAKPSKEKEGKEAETKDKKTEKKKTDKKKTDKKKLEKAPAKSKTKSKKTDEQ